MPGPRRPTRPLLPIAPLDPLGREIQQVLELLKPMLEDDGGVQYDGYCGSASQAYLHLAGGRTSGLKVRRKGNRDGSSHWWLEGPRGVVDLTLGPRDRRDIRAGRRRRYPYEGGTGAMFMGGYERPSKRAQAVIELVRWRRDPRWPSS